MKLSVIIPVFNEIRSIDEILRRVEAAVLPPQWQKEIIIVDDQSTDGTREKILSYTDGHRVILRDHNGGKGAALKTGLRETSGDFILIQDADLEYDPNDYHALLSALSREHSVIFGSRLRKNSVLKNEYYSLTYLYGSKLLTATFNLFFGSKINDMTTCYKLFPRTVIDRLLAWPEDDFVFDAVCLTYELQAFSSAGIIEVPIRYSPRSREDGKKVSWRHGVKCLVKMVRIFLTKRNLGDTFERHGQFVKYLIAGSFVYAVHLSAFYFFTEVKGLHYLPSVAYAFFTAFSVSFFLQRFWTFAGSASERVHRQAWKYLLLQLINLFSNMSLMYLFVEHMRVRTLLSQVIISFGLAMITFYISKKHVFR